MDVIITGGIEKNHPLSDSAGTECTVDSTA